MYNVKELHPNAKWVIKICGNKESYRHKMVKLCIEDSSIGVHYTIVKPLGFFGNVNTDEDLHKELISNYVDAGYMDTEGGRKVIQSYKDYKYCGSMNINSQFTQINHFINGMKDGDKVILALGENALYVAELDGGHYFTNESKWVSYPENRTRKDCKVGFFTRRKLKNIKKLPNNTGWSGLPRMFTVAKFSE